MIAAALGALVGLVLALTGAGGAILAVPLLMFAFHWEVAHAAPVALVAVSGAAAVGSLLGLRTGIVRYRAALLMAVVGSVMTPLGLLAAHHLPTQPLTLIFAGVLMVVARNMFVQARQQLRGLDHPAAPDTSACKLSQTTGRFRWTALCTRALSQAGAITGLLSGLLGVGGGFVIVPALRRSTDLPMNAIVATSLMVVAVVSASGALAAFFSGKLDVAVALPFAAGAIAAMLAGRSFASRVAGPRMQQGFALVTGVVASSLIVRAFA